MLQWYRDWRRQQQLRRAQFNDALFRAMVSNAPYMRGLSKSDIERLRELCIRFLAQKEFTGAAGAVITDEVRHTVAVQACLMILNLDMDYYGGWSGIIIYPDQFVPRHQYVDGAGVVHINPRAMAGEAWSNGPIILSWEDTKHSYLDDGVNVVIHEFAHKLDMLNGAPNGYPPLHKGMNRDAWSQTFRAAYLDFCRRVDQVEQNLPLDPYASESPAEFFAVASEAFFEAPEDLIELYPEAYQQLVAFYKQDTFLRLTADSQAVI